MAALLLAWCLALATLHLAAAVSGPRACPEGVRPGEFYPDAERLIRRARAESRSHYCWQWGLVSSIGEAPEGGYGRCSGDGEPRCVWEQTWAYHRAYGGFLCPLASAADEACNVTSTEDCFDVNQCYDSYGQCSCRQCPCPVEGQRGPDCGICTPDNWDAAGGAVAPLGIGAVLHCDLSPEVLIHAMELYTFDPKAEPLLEIELFAGPGGEMRANLTLYHSLCSRQKVILTISGSACSHAVQPECEASGLDGQIPCLKCSGQIKLQSSPPDVTNSNRTTYYASDVMAFPRRFFRSMEGHDRQFVIQCEGLAPTETGPGAGCRLGLDFFPVNLGNLSCSVGSRCLEEGSSRGANLTSVLQSQAAPSGLFLAPWLAMGALFLLLGMWIKCAARYQFKAEPAPSEQPRIRISWQRLGASNVVKDLAGEVGPGCLTGIFGLEGAGKTTLLEILAGRLRPQEGVVCLNGEVETPARLRAATGFVQEASTCCDLDTVAEAVGFAAAISGGAFPPLGTLVQKQHSRISELSIGERRLVDIYIQLAQRPAVLLVDMPIAGLNSDAAYAVMEALREASESIPVICSMQQVTRDVAWRFHEVMQLADGRFVSRMSSERLLSTIARLGTLSDSGVSASTQPSDEADTQGQSNASATPEGSAGNAFSDSSATQTSIVRTCSPTEAQELEKLWGREQTVWLPKRVFLLAMRHMKRSIRRGKWRYIMSFLFATLMGLGFWDLDVSPAGLSHRVVVINVCVVYVGLQAVSTYRDLAATRKSSTHEIECYLYGYFDEAVVHVAWQALEQALHASIVTLMVYPMVGLRPGATRQVVFATSLTVVAYVSSCLVCLCCGRRSSDLGMLVAAIAVTQTFVKLWWHQSNRSDPTDKVLPMRDALQQLCVQELVGLVSEMSRVGSMNTPRWLLWGVMDFYDLSRAFDQSFVADVSAGLGYMALAWTVIAVVALTFSPWFSLPWPWRLPPRTKPSQQSIVEILSEFTNCTMSQAAACGERNLTELSWTNLCNRDVHSLEGGVRAGNFLCVTGAVGSGKTTLVQMLAGCMQPTEGEICINGKAAKPHQLKQVVGFLPHLEALCPDDTVADALAFTQLLWGKPRSMPPHKSADGLLSRPVGSLSAGQQRIVAVFIQLARRPSILIMDEPMRSVAAASSAELMALLGAVSVQIPVIVTMSRPQLEACGPLTDFMLLSSGELRVSMPFESLRAFMKAHRARPTGTPVLARAADTSGADLISMVIASLDSLRHVHREQVIHPFQGEARCDVDTARTRDAPYSARKQAHRCRRSFIVTCSALTVRELRRLWAAHRQQLFLHLAWQAAVASVLVVSLKPKQLWGRVFLAYAVPSSIAVLSAQGITDFIRRWASIQQELELRHIRAEEYAVAHAAASCVLRLPTALVVGMAVLALQQVRHGEPFSSLALMLPAVIFAMAVVMDLLVFALCCIIPVAEGAMRLFMGFLAFFMISQALQGANTMSLASSYTSSLTWGGATGYELEESFFTEGIRHCSFMHNILMLQMKIYIDPASRYWLSIMSIMGTTVRRHYQVDSLSAVEHFVVLLVWAAGFTGLSIVGLKLWVWPRTRAGQA